MQASKTAAEADAEKQIPEGMDERSLRVAALLEKPILIAAALTLPTVAISESHPGGALETIADVLNWTTWIVFLVEVIVMLAVVPNRWTWVKRHPLDIIIVVLTPPILPATLQSLRVFRLLRLVRLLRLAQVSRQVFSLQGLRYSALLALLVIVAGGAVFNAFEHEQHLSAWQGMYWAITSMTTLGSNIYPQTLGGQITSVFIVLIGIAFVALLTGAVAQRFLGPEISETEAKLAMGDESAEAAAIRQLEQMQSQLHELQVSVSRMVEASPRAGADAP